MTSALIGFGFIVLIAATTAALGALTRLLTARVLVPGPERSAAADREDGGDRPRPLHLGERLIGVEATIARELQPDDLHPVARSAGAREQGPMNRPAGADPRLDLAASDPLAATHVLR